MIIIGNHSAPLLSKVGTSLCAEQIGFFLGIPKGPGDAITGGVAMNSALKQLAKRKLIGKPKVDSAPLSPSSSLESQTSA